QISHRIASLNHAREHTAEPARRALHCVGCADAPIPAHADAVEGAADDKGRVVGREPGEHCEEREVQHAEDEWALATESIGKSTEEQRAQRPHGERESERVDDRGLGYVEVLGKGVEEKDDYEEVEGVQHPAENSGGNGKPPAFGLAVDRGVCAGYKRHVQLAI